MMNLIDMILHVDKYLNVIIGNFGMWVYLILFLIIFCETGLVVIPFLPGDSLIFATGALAASGPLNVGILAIILFLAAILGDTLNYHIGRKVGKGLEEKKNLKFINKENLNKANDFYKKHGSITIVIARFIPIVRTFAPFLAGASEMPYKTFISFNIIGGGLWIGIVLTAGYFFGNLPFVRDNFSLVVIAIIIISLIPALIGVLSGKGKKQEA